MIIFNSYFDITRGNGKIIPLPRLMHGVAGGKCKPQHQKRDELVSDAEQKHVKVDNV
jgi:hypothetical protein